MKYIAYNNRKIDQTSDLYRRLCLSADRLNGYMYTGQSLFHDSPGSQSQDWPGDWEGRAALAWVLLSRALDKKVGRIDDMIIELRQHLNAHGYMGCIPEEGKINEQQLSGNSWLLRALCELYEWKGEEKVLEYINGIINGLLLPAKEKYLVYPISAEKRIRHGGKESGNIEGEIDGWLTSTDIGCAYMMLDGSTHAYCITKNEKLKELIEIMIDRFMTADFTGAMFQTHATLSAVRGILRFYSSIGDIKYLDHAKKIFELYKDYGMSENYANYNWFGRPEWTEPCAIVDSYMVAMQLWMYTNEEQYLLDARHIWFNALAPAQRENGGFGCDLCTGSDTPLFGYSQPGAYEAWWCCTMRGAEGLSVTSIYSVTYEDDTVYIAFPWEGVYSFTGLTFKLTTTYPQSAHTCIEVLENSTGSFKNIVLYKSVYEGGELKLVPVKYNNCLNKGSSIALDYDMPLFLKQACKEKYSECHTINRDCMQLAENDDKELIYLADRTYETKDEYLSKRMRLIF